ncbi:MULTISPECIES: hypothetical protein [Pseudomonadota]|jgi:hypothetical protein|uniref:hypothetical protein n=1 Tax=Pseudomonadota TaxID=1224 RepID=UPI001B0FC341|nr:MULTISPECIES: hypothetical protein [Pseudomonadota]MBO6812978.1 hypothetical protein [Marinobacter sp.]MBO6842682.1 hypothetical protein [Thalassospira sp.]MBO6875627.1 hypothetical protein [Marinobacter sp.]MCR9188470.1 hypothetical protein [Alteromonadaceae bacterium]
MNEMKKIRVDHILLSLMKQQTNSPFSTTSIRDLYLAQISHPTNPDRNLIRKHIYKELLRLESASVIERHDGETGRGCKFIFRGVPSAISLENKRSPFAQPEQKNESSIDPATLKRLKEELSKRKVELVASIGEAEEYQRLYNKFPALQQTVRTQYLESRDRSTKLLGQLRAVETVLADIGWDA